MVQLLLGPLIAIGIGRLSAEVVDSSCSVNPEDCARSEDTADEDTAALQTRSSSLTRVLSAAASNSTSRKKNSVPHKRFKPKKPFALFVSDIDYTLFGIGSSLMGTTPPLYSELFWDDAFQLGDVWGLARGLVPNITSVKEDGILGPESILSTSHPWFGTSSPIETRFAINSDGPSLTQYLYNETLGEPFNNTDQNKAIWSLRTSADWNPYWNVLDFTIYSCFGKYNQSTGMTFWEYRMNPVQQHCADFGMKDVMLQNILDFYADTGAEMFDYIFFVDDQGSNLETIKTAPNLGGVYTFGGAGGGGFQERRNISTDKIFLAYPTGDTTQGVNPKGNGSYPCCCGGCFFVPANSPNEISPYQAMIAGLGIEHFYSTIGSDLSLSGSHPKLGDLA